MKVECERKKKDKVVRDLAAPEIQALVAGYSTLGRAWTSFKFMQSWIEHGADMYDFKPSN